MAVSKSICRHFSTVIHSFCLPTTHLIPPLSTHTQTHKHTHTHTHTLQQQSSVCHYVHYYSILPELTNRRRAWNPELQWPEPRLSPCNGGKTFISLLSCPGPISALPPGYLDPLWLQKNPSMGKVSLSSHFFFLQQIN